MATGAIMSQSSMIEFSAVIPTYNRADLVVRAVSSALGQSLPPAEIIVVDDGSTDDTEAALRAYGPAVRYVRQQNSGGAVARNRGVAEAQHEWIAFLDSDDVWTETHLARMRDAIAATGGAAVLYFDDMRVGESPEETWWERGGFTIQEEHTLVSDGTEWVLREFQPMMLQSAVCHRGTFLAEGGLWADLRNAHDTHFFLKMGIGKPVCAVRGIGSRLLADAPGEGRLTSVGQMKRRYANRITGFGDILRRYPQLTAAQRRCLRERIATSHWTLGRYAWQERQPLQFGRRVLQSFLSDPATMFRLATGAARRARDAGDAPQEPMDRMNP